MLTEDRQYQATPVASERNFGIVFCVVAATVAAYGWWREWNLVTVMTLAALSAAMLFLGLVTPRTLEIPNRLWAKFGLLLALVITPIIMALVFMVAVIPSGLLMRLFGKDPMKRGMDPQASTYWIKRDRPPGPMRQQF